MSRVEELRERVKAFGRMELPGQPMGMHMGTLYLVNGLSAEMERLQSELASAKAANDLLSGERQQAYALYEKWRGDAYTNWDEVLKLRTDLAEALAALEPFALCGSNFWINMSDDYRINLRGQDDRMSQVNIPLNLLRRAAALVAKHKDSTHDK